MAAVVVDDAQTGVDDPPDDLQELLILQHRLQIRFGRCVAFVSEKDPLQAELDPMIRDFLFLQ